MTGKIFVLGEDGKLTPLDEAPYGLEDVLQGLLADYPDLLAGDQISPENPRRWLLVTREAGVPDSDSGSAADRWALDHVFVDQDGVPTLVEVKRSSDTRLRREVVGQMLDYAANAVVYWPPERIRQRFEARCEAQGEDPDALVAGFVGEDGDVEGFWQQVRTNLQAQRIRIVLVSDEIPRETQRIIEFLNGQMDPAEVLGVQIRQYVGADIKTLVPRVLGLTAEAEQKKGSPRPRRRWDPLSFDDDLVRRRGRQEAAAARRIREWAEAVGLPIDWGTGSTYGTFMPRVEHRGLRQAIFSVSSGGEIQVYFGGMNAPPFDRLDRREELLDRLQSIPGIDMKVSDLEKSWPIFRLEVLASDDVRLQKFLEVWEWFMAEMKDM